MTLVEDFMREFRRRSISSDRLFRLACVEYFEGKSKEEIVDTLSECGMSREDAESRYDKIVEVASKVRIHSGPFGRVG